jgi:hypothetical protein
MSKNPLTAEQREMLKRALASGSRLGASDLRLINVDVYRERLGADWFKYKAIIHALAAAAVKAELGGDDFFVETKAGYGIFFFKKDLAEVQVISDRISERLRRELSREPAFGKPPLGCEATSVNCDDLLRQLEGEAEPSPAIVEAPPVVPAKPSAAGPGGLYAPLWHTKLQRVVGSVFAPPPPTIQRRLSDNDYFSAQEAYVQHDIGCFSAMLADAYKVHKAGQSTTIIFSLNFQTFCVPKFNKEYMQALRQTPASLLQYLTPRLVRIPPGTAQQQLAEKVQALSGTFKHVVLHSRPLLDQRTFEFVPCSILSTSWKDIERTVNADRAVRTPAGLAKQFSQSAKLLRQNSLITGIDARESLDAVIGAGVEFISGAAVLPFSDKPFGQRQLTLQDIRAPHIPAPAPTPASFDPQDIELV